MLQASQEKRSRRLFVYKQREDFAKVHHFIAYFLIELFVCSVALKAYTHATNALSGRKQLRLAPSKTMCNQKNQQENEIILCSEKSVFCIRCEMLQP